MELLQEIIMYGWNLYFMYEFIFSSLGYLGSLLCIMEFIDPSNNKKREFKWLFLSMVLFGVGFFVTPVRWK